MTRAPALPPALTFAGQTMRAFPDGALYWTERRALIFADLHFEKASWFARGGQMLPPYDSAATLSAMAALIAASDPAEIWCLGDSFHDGEGPLRLPAALAGMLCTLAEGRRWTWITGNHDLHAGGLPCGEVAAEVRIGDIVLRHEAVPGETRYELSGHYHPKLRVRLRGRMVSRRCFVRGATRLILPAFGQLTGGLDATAPVLRALAGPDGEALVPVSEQLLRFGIEARRNVIFNL